MPVLSQDLSRHSETVRLACELISRPSVTPQDAGCQALLGERLSALGFVLEPMRFGEVDNLWAVHGDGAPCLVFAGHTDVVPTGPVEAWTHPPFEPTFDGAMLFGRGAADMKGSLAAMVQAAGRFIEACPKHRGTLAFLLTSDEEGSAVDGTVRVVETLQGRGHAIDWCLVGEPSSTSAVGDTVRHGRRGSLNGRLVVRGVQGHVAYADRVVNPIHGACAALGELAGRTWDAGSDDFPPTSFQVSNIRSGTGAVNVVPGELEALFNFRYSTALTHEQLMTEVQSTLARHRLDYSVDWNHSGRPFLTKGGELVEAASRAIADVTGRRPELSTSGGTSDGRFIAPTGAQVLELGPVNETIHKIDECVDHRDLDRLTEIYAGVLQHLLSPASASSRRGAG